MSTVDQQAFIVNSDGTTNQAMVTATFSGGTVTGIEKLAQRFTVNLLTQKGSIPYLPLKGTNLVTMLQTGSFSTEQDVFVAFAASLVDLNRQMKSEQSTTDPSDEIYQSARLVTVVISQGSITLYIQVKSAASLTTMFALPLNFILQ